MDSTTTTQGLSALNENGEAVDWWFAYKVPQLSKTATSDAAVGYEYVYYDPTLANLVQSPYLLSDGNGAVDLTLNSVFDNPSPTTGWILYNDEMPESVNREDSSAYGHTKGVLVFDTATNTGFWLLHSWPKYSDPGVKTMPTPKYGQTFLCISLDMDNLNAIAAQMIEHQTPQVFSPRIPESLSTSDALYSLAQQISTNPTADSSALDCTSRGGMAFKVIAKNHRWNKDFWNDLVGPTLSTDMDVETWIRGAIPSTQDSDGVHKVIDVKYIDLNPLGFPWSWSETHDHAKWGIGVDSDWVCIGDINRMISQEKRGGGTIAFQEPTLWAALSKTDLLVPPTGGTDTDAKAIIKSTHDTTNTAH